MVSKYFENLENTLKEDDEFIPCTHIFNYDETNFSDGPGVKKCVFKRGVKYAERIKDSSKTSISIMYCGSAAGRLIPSYVVYKSEHLWSTWSEGGPAGTRYNRSRCGWFDACCFTDWFETLFIPYARSLPGRKVIIGDNLSSHFTEKVLILAEKHNVEFACLPPNSTHLLQPLDVAFYGPLKRHWRKVLDDWKCSRGKRTSTLSKDAFPRLLKRLHSKLFTGEENHSDNLVSGFRKCGIFPFSPNAALERLPDRDRQLLNDSSVSVEDISSNVSLAVIDILKSMRGVDEEPTRKRRKKINVEPGKSITSTDLNKPSISRPCNSNDQQHNDNAEPDDDIAEPDDDNDEQGHDSVQQDHDNEEQGDDSEEQSDESEEQDDDSEEQDVGNFDQDGDGSNQKNDAGNIRQDADVRENAATGQFVIVTYEGQTFPGKIISLDTEGALVSTLTKCKNVGWRWPNFKDEIDYEWKNILKCNVKALPMNNRGSFRFPDLEDEWGK